MKYSSFVRLCLSIYRITGQVPCKRHKNTNAIQIEITGIYGTRGNYHHFVDALSYYLVISRLSREFSDQIILIRI